MGDIRNPCFPTGCSLSLRTLTHSSTPFSHTGQIKAFRRLPCCSVQKVQLGSVTAQPSDTRTAPGHPLCIGTQRTGARGEEKGELGSVPIISSIYFLLVCKTTCETACLRCTRVYDRVRIKCIWVSLHSRARRPLWLRRGFRGRKSRAPRRCNAPRSHGAAPAATARCPPFLICMHAVDWMASPHASLLTSEASRPIALRAPRHWLPAAVSIRGDLHAGRAAVGAERAGAVTRTSQRGTAAVARACQRYVIACAGRKGRVTLRRDVHVCTCLCGTLTIRGSTWTTGAAPPRPRTTAGRAPCSDTRRRGAASHSRSLCHLSALGGRPFAAPELSFRAAPRHGGEHQSARGPWSVDERFTRRRETLRRDWRLLGTGALQRALQGRSLHAAGRSEGRYA